MRQRLEFRGCNFLECDVELHRPALARMREPTGGRRVLPVLIEDGKLLQSGWQGRGCPVGENAGGNAGENAGGKAGER